MNSTIYSVGNIVNSLKNSLHRYLEAQYHIWDESLIRERSALFNNPDEAITNQVPALEATPFYGYGKNFEQLDIPAPAKEALIKASKLGVGIYSKPYRHQAEALEAFLTGHHDIIVATGTGSGKTESFLMPLLGSLAMEAHDHSTTAALPGMRALLLYPMNALVNDQLSRLRRLFGNSEVADILSNNRRRRVTFGMYTSRTPYPGKRQGSKDKRIVGKLVEQLFGADALAVKQLLEKEGKWPAKDMEAFAASNFHTHPNDRELYTRQEMHERCPDLLITNYSMLEYMLLRPVEKTLFDQTEQWLAADASNQLIVVLDEAHMYRGATGAEVGLLLRRLQSRLRVDRKRIRYILTSASLGSSADAQQKIVEFAGELTGLSDTGHKFHLIKGNPEKMQAGQPATPKDIAALKGYSYAALHSTKEDLATAVSATNELLLQVGKKPLGTIRTESELRNAIYEFLEQYPPACALANLITGKPHTFHEILESVFGQYPDGREALESLLALAAFAQRNSDSRVFLPVRLHTFYRGISGLYACVNPECPHRLDKSSTSHILGRLFDSPRRRCSCGSRVYELLTHRDCGAAFIRAYLRSREGDFAWHEAGSSHDNGRALLEVHFLVESSRNRAEDTCTVWLHKKTGRIFRKQPSHIGDFIELVQSAGDILRDTGISVHSFDHECPVCLRGWDKGTNKIMDLATKGEAPFAHLTATQLRLQPSFMKPDAKFPNQGRKNLLFSDGRQKAARLARDIPREVGQDVFRQILLYAAHSLNKENKEAKLDKIYPAILFVLKKFNLRLFDGKDYQKIVDDLLSMKREGYDTIIECTDEFSSSPPPDRFNEQLLRQLGNSFYSIHGLTLGYVVPTDRAMRNLEVELSWLDAEEVKALAVAWIQNLLNKMAYDASIGNGVRCRAAGWYSSGWGVSAGFQKKKLPIIEGIYGDASKIEAAFKGMLAQQQNGAYFIEPRRVKLEVAVHAAWHQCQKCLYLSPVTWKLHCVNCGEADTKRLNPANNDYLRARKTFWRDPVISILEDKASPFNLNVCEHTAQLSYRDQDEIKSTTEEYERLFKDILLRPDEYPIDMLSCTTTMEVGIDIGSLIAVGLRNVPPQRQNYQQRVGRAGRRGAAISTVMTYAQNSPHDYFYFKNIKKVIAGDPPLPMVDICNPRLIKRHVNATLIQHFFHTQVVNSKQKNNIFDVLGETWEFYNGSGDLTFNRFKEWLKEDAEKEGVFKSIQHWIPKNAHLTAQKVAAEFVNALTDNRPLTQDELAGNGSSLIEFLFNRGLMPSYAFPRDLCALQIEKRQKNSDGRWEIEIVEKPQQGLNVALSEYAPGRLVVVDKQTYRIAAVTANRLSTAKDRATPLFQNIKTYNHCHDCCFTQTSTENAKNGDKCPVCGGIHYEAINVIQPEVVFPEDCGPIDELDDEQVFSTSTSAQLPVPRTEEELQWHPAGKHARFAYAENQSLVMLNKGKIDSNGQHSGFLVCDKCGHAVFPDQPNNSPHPVHYLIQQQWGVERPSCDGTYQLVSLGYSFPSDLLLFNIVLTKPLDTKIEVLASRMALEDALLSLSDAISLAACHTLDIDLRELNAGYRLINRRGVLTADIFLYDAVAGGAGYSAMAGAQFDKILEAAKHILDDCTCDTSCDKCLRHYGNKHYHSRLDRNLASDLLEYAKDGILPQIKEINDQLAELAALKQVLEMAGWAYEHAPDVPLLMKLQEKVLKIATCPALLDPHAAGHKHVGTCKVVSSYTLQNNLAGVFAEVGS